MKDVPPELRAGEGPFRSDQIRSGDRYELSDGHAIYCLPTGGQGAAKARLGVFSILSDPAAADSGVDPGFSPRKDMLRAPDLAVGGVKDEPGWIEGVPLLAVEYADTGQDEKELRKKILELLREGTRLIWVVRLVGPPRVEVFEKDTLPRTFGLDDVLEAPGILQNPVPVRSIFEPQAALDAGLRNLLQRKGYASLEALRAEAKDEGKLEGKVEGKVEGRAEGRAEGKAEALLRVFSARGLDVSPTQRERIVSNQDAAELDRWIGEAVTASSVEDALRPDPKS